MSELLSCEGLDAYPRTDAPTTAKSGPTPSIGKSLIASISSGVPKALVELTKLGRTLKKRAADVLAYFDRPSTSNGPTEAINGRLEHLRGSALGFRNMTNYGAYAEFRISDGMSTSGLC